MAGEYRAPGVLARLPGWLREDIAAGLRIARADIPIIGCDIRPDLSGRMAEAYDAIGMADVAAGLRDGSMVPAWPRRGGGRAWAPGELFMRS